MRVRWLAEIAGAGLFVGGLAGLAAMFQRGLPLPWLSLAWLFVCYVVDVLVGRAWTLLLPFALVLMLGAADCVQGQAPHEGEAALLLRLLYWIAPALVGIGLGGATIRLVDWWVEREDAATAQR